jgi:hypothetical protein
VLGSCSRISSHVTGLLLHRLAHLRSAVRIRVFAVPTGSLELGDLALVFPPK